MRSFLLGLSRLGRLLITRGLGADGGAPAVVERPGCLDLSVTPTAALTPSLDATALLTPAVAPTATLTLTVETC